MDFHQVTRLIQILQDGAVSPEEGKELLDGVVIVLDSVRPHPSISHHTDRRSLIYEKP